jgi:hypothetical protein
MSVQPEENDVNIRAIFAFGAGLAAVALAVYLVVWLLFVYFDRREASSRPSEFPLAVGHEARQPPEPRLQVSPREDLQQLRSRQQQLLDSYQWVDKAAGTVRIPIGEAMRLTVERGLPTRSQTLEEKK